MTPLFTIGSVLLGKTATEITKHGVRFHDNSFMYLKEVEELLADPNVTNSPTFRQSA